MPIFYLKLLVLHLYLSLFSAAPQNPELLDQSTLTSEPVTTTVAPETTEGPVIFIKTSNSDDAINSYNSPSPSIETPVEAVHTFNATDENKNAAQILKTAPDVRDMKLENSFFTRIYSIVLQPFQAFLRAPKVNIVLKNVGTCIVNGAMEIITHYLPAPLIPLIASAAGMVIPFEPVVMLKQRMPAAISYRRAIKSAVNSFLGTFDRYKPDSSMDDDPYMAARFNRRFMNNDNYGNNNRRKRNNNKYK